MTGRARHYGGPSSCVQGIIARMDLPAGVDPWTCSACGETYLDRPKPDGRPLICWECVLELR
jgi:hypothetical protein